MIDATQYPALLAERCRHCGHCAVPAIGPGAGPHAAKALCFACGGFIKWVPKRVVQQLEAAQAGAA